VHAHRSIQSVRAWRSDRSGRPAGLRCACHEEGLSNGVVQVGCVCGGLGHSVRQWVKKKRRQRRQASDASELDQLREVRLRPGTVPAFSPCMDMVASHADRTRWPAYARPVFLFTRPGPGRQAPDAAMPPCVWRWHTGRGLPHAPRPSAVPLKRSASIRSVRRSIDRRRRTEGQHMLCNVCICMHAHRSPEENNTKSTQPITLALLSLSRHACLSLSHLCPHILLYCPLSWKPTQVTHLSLSLRPAVCLSSPSCVFHLSSLLLLAWCGEKIAHFPQPHLSHPASPPPYLLFCPPQKLNKLAGSLACLVLATPKQIGPTCNYFKRSLSLP
jgi:hypothetical protein